MSTATPTTTFTYDGQQIRTTVTDTGEPLFALIDLCRVLEINNPSHVARRLDDDELTLIQAEGKRGRHRLNAVTEAGMYEVVLRSDKPEARTFRRWITHEVLPQLRRTGTYTTPQHSQPTLPHTGKAEPVATVTAYDAGARPEDDGGLVPRMEVPRPSREMPMQWNLLIVTGSDQQGRHFTDEIMYVSPDRRSWVSTRIENGRPAYVLTRPEQVERYWQAEAVRSRQVDAAKQILHSHNDMVRARGAGAILTEIVGTAVTPQWTLNA